MEYLMLLGLLISINGAPANRPPTGPASKKKELLFTVFTLCRAFF